jgi:hypothetical protein
LRYLDLGRERKWMKRADNPVLRGRKGLNMNKNYALNEILTINGQRMNYSLYGKEAKAQNT